MADREMIAATLTAALLQSAQPEGPGRKAEADKAAIARHAVSLYETILGMLPTAKR
jgi:hypothetical protein